MNVMVIQYMSSVTGISLPTDYSHRRVNVHGCTVRSPLTGCQVTSRPHDGFSIYVMDRNFPDSPHTFYFLIST